MKIIAYKCPQCGANLEIEQGRKEVFCSFCGTKLFIDDETKTMRIEKNTNINNTFRYTNDAKVIREKNKFEMKKIEQENKFKILLILIELWIFMLLYVNLMVFLEK